MSKKSKKKNKDAHDPASDNKDKQRQSQSQDGNQKLGKKEYEAELFNLQVELGRTGGYL